MTEPVPFQVLMYQTEDGRRPVEDWLAQFQGNTRAFAAIQTRIDRLERGLVSDWKGVGSGVQELRIDHGPGYRVYFGRDGKSVVILLCGGDKGTQARDIRRAQQYWSDYEKRKRAGSSPV